MIYGVWAFAIIAKYGNENFGVLYGVIAVLAGVLNILLANPVNSHALRHHSYVEVNFVIAVIGFTFIFYPFVMGIREWFKRKSDYEPLE
jgi:hypothetical protein